MHGLICKAVEGFVRDQHGAGAWADVRARARLDFEQFESLRLYDPQVAEAMIEATAARLDRDRDALFEDLGVWICTHPPLEAVRRLIRFSGSDFVNLLYALDELHDRACMAVPGLALPHYRLEQDSAGQYDVHSRWRFAGAAALLTGVLRAMADDYGTLAVIEAGAARRSGDHWIERIHVRVVAQEFSAPREFTLGGPL